MGLRLWLGSAWQPRAGLAGPASYVATRLLVCGWGARMSASIRFRLELAEVPGGSYSLVAAGKANRLRSVSGGHHAIARAPQDRLGEAAHGGLVLRDEDRLGAAHVPASLSLLARLDLALLDIVMPRRGGPQVAARLREERPEVPIIFSSGYAQGIADAGDLPGASLPKPYRPSELLELIRSTLDKTRRG